MYRKYLFLSEKAFTHYYFSSKKNLSHYYRILNLTPGYKEEELKNSYLELVKKYHPDLNKDPNAIQKFQQIQQAYDILTNPQKVKQLFNEPRYQQRNKKSKMHEYQQNEKATKFQDYMKGFEDRLADRYQNVHRKNEGMKFSYNLYKKHYEQVQQKKKQYKRYYGNGKQYFAKQNQKPDNLLKSIGISAMMIGIASGAIWLVNKK